MIFYTFFFTLLVFLGFPKYLNNFKKLKLLFELTFFILIIFVAGLRYEIGGDWKNYYIQFQGFATFGFPSMAIFTSSDPLYILINILSHKIGAGVEIVNLISTIILFSGFYFNVKRYDHTALSIVVSFLFFFIILSMGFSRQSLAIGFILYSLFFYFHKKYFLQFCFIIFSLLSHKSSLVFFLFFFTSIFLNQLKFINRKLIQYLKKNLLRILILSLIIMTLCILLIFRDLQRIFEVYLIGERELHLSLNQARTSAGVIYKYPILLFFSFLYLFNKKKLNFLNNQERNIFDTFMLLSLFLLPLVGMFSLLVDRILIYFYPFIGIFIGKFFKDCVDRENYFKLYIFCSIISLTVTLIWLKFANHASFWIPYKNYLFLNY